MIQWPRKRKSNKKAAIQFLYHQQPRTRMNNIWQPRRSMSIKKAVIQFLYQQWPRRKINNDNTNAVIIHNVTGLNCQTEQTKTNYMISLIHFHWEQYFNAMNNDLPLLYNLLQRKNINNGQHLFYAGVSNKANNAMTSFLYNGEYL